MSDQVLPYFKFYPKKWMSGTVRDLDPMEQGVFIILCNLIWDNGGRYKRKPLMHRKFNITEQVLNNCLQVLTDVQIVFEDKYGYGVKFLDEQLEEYKDIRDKRSKAGKLSGVARTKKNTCSTSDEQVLNKSQQYNIKDKDKDIKEKSIKKKSGSTSENKITPGMIEDIYLAYPKQSKKVKAERAIAHALTKELVSPEELQKHVKAYSIAVTKWEDHTWIPDCHNWIENQQWLDDPKTWEKPAESAKGENQKRTPARKEYTNEF